LTGAPGVTYFTLATRRPLPNLGKATVFAILQAAGWPIWFLLAASVIAVALIIERTVSLRRDKVVPPTLLDQVVTVYQRHGVSEEVLERLAKDSPLGVVLAEIDEIAKATFRSITLATMLKLVERRRALAG
jgi:biopolymer transport protein ExbB